MSIRLRALLPWVLLLALGAQAQTPAPAKPDSKPDAKADPKADAAAEAAAAMERAKRMAAGPMRVILEASKARRREPEANPAPADANSVRPVATRSIAAAEPAPRQATAPAPATVVSEAPPAPAVTTPASTPVSTQITLNSESLQNRSAVPVPGLDRQAVEPTPPPAAAPLSLPALPQGPVKPRLINRVDPDVAQRLLDDLGRNAVIPVDLSIRANGTVAQVTVVANVPARLQRAIVVALEQWRFDPLPSDRVHRIELLFNAE